jgi:predicted metal-dependent phosphoesterase TrpH
MQDQNGFWRVDLHTHTCFSDGTTDIPQHLRAAHRAGLQRVAVTDHNKLQGALEAARLEPEFVIPGEEIETTEGELLGYFVQEEVPSGLHPEEAIARLRDQGAVISVSHPFDRLRAPWREDALLRILPLVDAIEGFNARCMSAAPNRHAVAFALAHRKPITAGSDAHTAFELGAAGLEMAPFTDAASFRSALADARPFGRPSPRWVHFFSRYAVLRKRLRRSK